MSSTTTQSGSCTGQEGRAASTMKPCAFLMSAVAVLLGAGANPAQAQSGPAGLPPFFTRHPGTAATMPPAAGWENDGTDTYTFYAGEEIWIAFENEDYDDDAWKEVTLKLTWIPDPNDPNDVSLGLVSVAKERVGFRMGDQSTSNPPIPSGLRWYGGTSSANLYSLYITFDVCVAWERFKFVHNGSGDQKTTFKAHLVSSCWLKGNPFDDDDSDDDGLSDDNEFKIQEGSFGAEGAMGGKMRITEIQLFPTTETLNFEAPVEFLAAPETGEWLQEFVFVDPLGEPRPSAGVRWFTDGIGLQAGDIYSLRLSTVNTFDRYYEMFIFDADVNEYADLVFYNEKAPWYEAFDDYGPDDTVIGQGFWKGWDNDPAFSAPVTNAQARSDLQSVDISGDADLVREFVTGFPTHALGDVWAHSTWQYIPGDFQSGGNGQFAGSYFILLNTYSDGGPYNWSVQMQFDSNDGMLKVFHGDGTNTIDVPYITDRWVKIEAIIDLDDDWTQVYYDDNLIAEYSWTGGILGEGGGALDIAAVDLYAQGSSSIFYDDLVLEKIEAPSEPCPADLDGDGSVGVVDLLMLLGAWDTDPGGPPDFDGDGTVGVADLLVLLGLWGSCP